MVKRYRVRLAEEEQEELMALVSRGREAAYKQTHVSMEPGNWATVVSKASINVRVGVQHKCHFLMVPLYRMLTQ